jgi:hypothetical protein
MLSVAELAMLLLIGCCGIIQDVLLPHELAWLHEQQHFSVAASQVCTVTQRTYDGAQCWEDFKFDI